MDNKKLIIIAVALSVATVAILKLYANSMEKEFKTVKDPVFVLASENEVAAGAEIKEVAAMKLAKRHSHPDAILLKDPATGQSNLELVKGALASRALAKEQILLWSDIIPKEGAMARDTLSTVLKPGCRAVTIKADAGSVHDGLLRVGDRVDVLCTLASPREGDLNTKTLLQNVTTLAVGGKIHKALGRIGRVRRATSVTLELTPDQAELLIFAQQKGALSLVLRAEADTQDVALPGKNFWDIFDKPSAGPAPDEFTTLIKEIRTELAGLSKVAIERVGDKVQLAGVVYNEEEMARVKVCAQRHADMVDNKVILNPTATTELKRNRNR